MSEKASPKCTHRFPTDLRQRICEWFDAIQTAAYNEELERLVEIGLSDSDYDQPKLTEENVRRYAAEIIEADRVIDRMMEECDQNKLACAVIEALLVENDFGRVKVQEERYCWLWPASRPNQLIGRSQPKTPSCPPVASP